MLTKMRIAVTAVVKTLTIDGMQADVAVVRGGMTFKPLAICKMIINITMIVVIVVGIIKIIK